MQSSPKHRFITLPSHVLFQEVGEQLADQTPVLFRGSIYQYKLPGPSEKVRNVVVKEMESDLEKWAETQQMVISFEGHLGRPKFLKIKRNGDATSRLQTRKGQNAILLPFHKGSIDVSVCNLGGDGEYSVPWSCQFALHIGEGLEMWPLTGDLTFHLTPFELKARPTIATATEDDGGLNEA